ncbi:MAG TPA: prolyl oligopeptidase family serine peptidase [Pyrinomonadaceae bacterium]|jgi:dipeptidyl aminopeptidase/acylaminoacyl peptidase
MRKLLALSCLAAVLGSDASCAAPSGKAPAAQKESPAAQTPAAPAAALPELGEGRRLEPGVVFHEVRLPGRGAAGKLWVYLPESAARGKIPCVLIAPAGTRMFHGATLGEGDRPEHLPYARAGFAVVAYELDGPLEDDASEEEMFQAAELFRRAEAGLLNARAALDYALAKLPQVDASRVYTAGHSSAGTTSLLVAEREPRIAACVAYAPVTDLEKYFGEVALAELSAAMPDYGEFVKRVSPQAGLRELRRPLFLFHAEDDDMAPIAESAKFAAEVSKHNPAVTFVRAARGGHYDSMLKEGVPKAIAWLKALN